MSLFSKKPLGPQPKPVEKPSLAVAYGAQKAARKSTVRPSLSLSTEEQERPSSVAEAILRRKLGETSTIEPVSEELEGTPEPLKENYDDVDMTILDEPEDDGSMVSKIRSRMVAQRLK